MVTIGNLWEEELFVNTVQYPSDYGRHQGAHICRYLEWGLHDEHGEPGEATSDASCFWGGGALWEAQWVRGTGEQWHLQLVHCSKGAIAYHSSSRSIVGNCEKA